MLQQVVSFLHEEADSAEMEGFVISRTLDR